jgi:uncharacterized protein (DUF305 family)
MIGAIRWGVVCLLGVSGTGVSTQTPAPPLYTQEDLLFLHHMIVHHKQALELAALVPSRTKREELIRFAGYLDRAQRVEIDQMESLQRLAVDRGLTIPNHEQHRDESMPGLLDKARVDALSSVTGARFERLWLEGMIVHHEGALTMGLAQQQRQFESGRRPYGIDVLVDEIVVVQRGEITKMRGWLMEWGL